jgi:hypothetical protein
LAAFSYLVVLSVFASLMNGEFYDNKPTPNENADCGFRGIDGFDIHVGAGMGMCVAACFLSILQAILYCCVSQESVYN